MDSRLALARRPNVAIFEHAGSELRFAGAAAREFHKGCHEDLGGWGLGFRVI